MDPLPDTFTATREALHVLCCYAVSPARKARTGRIGLRPYGGGIATPPFDDGTRIVVRGDRLAVEPGQETTITTVREAAAFLGADVSAEPGVGQDLPPFEPDEDLAVDVAASLALGAWYGFGQDVLDHLQATMPAVAIGEAQLWPEHFDLAVSFETAGGGVNVGFSPGDALEQDPYVYVGPHDTSALDDPVWNAPFGAVMGRSDLAGRPDPGATALGFVERCLAALRGRVER
jgi:hypothetical protein